MVKTKAVPSYNSIHLKNLEPVFQRKIIRKCEKDKYKANTIQVIHTETNVNMHV